MFAWLTVSGSSLSRVSGRRRVRQEARRERTPKVVKVTSSGEEAYRCLPWKISQLVNFILWEKMEGCHICVIRVNNSNTKQAASAQGRETFIFNWSRTICRHHKMPTISPQKNTFSNGNSIKYLQLHSRP